MTLDVTAAPRRAPGGALAGVGASAYFEALQPQLVPHWQGLGQEHWSPQAQRAPLVAAHPQDEVLLQRHSD